MLHNELGTRVPQDVKRSNFVDPVICHPLLSSVELILSTSFERTDPSKTNGEMLAC